MTLNRLAALIGGLALALQLGCSDDGTPATNVPLDSGSDATAGNDNGPIGGEDPGAVTPDTGTDTGGTTDAQDGSTTLPDWFEKPCVSNDDCGDAATDGYCVPNGTDGSECTVGCGTAECPSGYSCQTIKNTGGSDGALACLPDVEVGCKQCTTEQDCLYADAKCIPVGMSEGAPDMRCARACGAGGACPTDYECKVIQAGAGAEESQLCVPKTNSCICIGEKDGTTEACTASNETGTCKGERTCDGENGWTACSAQTPAAEACDGLDNDCNGQTDDGLVGEDCEATNEFGTCKGKDVCQGEGGWSCDAPQAAAETCDGQDNDCDGTADDGLADADGDGACDDGQDTDDDNDNVDDGLDNCPNLSNPDQADVDKDGIGDACDSNIDSDDDLVDDAKDNCPNVSNPDQTDTDNDGQGDACDDDDDGDGDPDATDCKPLDGTIGKGGVEVCDGVDNNCNATIDEGFADTDADKLSDCIDKDDDNDTALDDADNCPTVANPDQADFDTDGQGDACDTDDDNDQVADNQDNCQFVPNPEQANHDTDAFGDACDTDDDNDGVLDDVDNCTVVANPGQTDLDGDGLGNACDDDKDGDAHTDKGAGGDDCDDLQPTVFQGAKEICDGLDNNCNGQIDEGYADTDKDGLCDGMDPDDDNDGDLDELDCSPLDSKINSLATEVCDAIDNNCNAKIDEGCPPTSVQVIFTSATVTGTTKSGLNVQMSLGLPGVVGQSKPQNGAGYSVDWGFYYTLP